MGIKFINNYTFWPGGKPGPDTLKNMVGDTFFATLGWYSAKMIKEKQIF